MRLSEIPFSFAKLKVAYFKVVSYLHYSNFDPNVHIIKLQEAQQTFAEMNSKVALELAKV